MKGMDAMKSIDYDPNHLKQILFYLHSHPGSWTEEFFQEMAISCVAKNLRKTEIVQVYGIILVDQRQGSTTGNRDQATVEGGGLAARCRRGCLRGAFHSVGTTRQPNSSANDH